LPDRLGRHAAALLPYHIPASANDSIADCQAADGLIFEVRAGLQILLRPIFWPAPFPSKTPEKLENEY